MNKWIKTLLCAVTAATLVACGGGDDAPATTTTGGLSASTIAGVSTGMESATGFAIDGVNAGFYGDFSLLVAPAGLESPMGESYTAPTCSNSGSGGTAILSSSVITYTNCKIGDATLDGKAKIVSNGGATPSYTVTFDTDTANPLKITGQGADGKTATFTYTGTEVVTNLQGSYPKYTGAKITLNVKVKIGTSSSVTLSNFVVEYSRSGAIDRTSINGKYTAAIKLADFSVPATPGVPDPLEVTFDVTTPTAIDYNYETDKDVAGVLRLSSASMFVVEIDYGAKKVRFTATGSPTQEFPLQ